MHRRLFIAIVLAAAFVACSATPALAIHRSVSMSRGRAWYWDKVPYSQSKYHAGYRTDCSGFVSMCWGLTNSSGSPLSLSTSTLYQVSSTIKASNLGPGDAMCYPGHHTFLFIAWTDLTKTSFVTLEEAGTAWGTVSRVRNLSTLSTGYKAIRFNKLEEDPRWSRHITPIAGADRYATAARASATGFAGGAGSVVIAGGTAWPDALSASALAGAVKGPILLVQPNRIPEPVKNEIARLKAKKAYVIGGPTIVSAGVVAGFKALGLSVERISGADRYATSDAMARRTVKLLADAGRTWDGTVFLAKGSTWPDALCAGALAAKKGWPVVLCRGTELGSGPSGLMSDLKVKKAILLGGEGAVSGTVWREVSRAGIEADRWSGADRHLTALAVAKGSAERGLSWSGVAVTSDATYADALAGAVMQANLGSMILLTPPRSMDRDVAAALKAHKTAIGSTVRVMGGEAAVDYTVRHAVYDILAAP
jgi:putative cell wall-binding protein